MIWQADGSVVQTTRQDTATKKIKSGRDPKEFGRFATAVHERQLWTNIYRRMNRKELRLGFDDRIAMLARNGWSHYQGYLDDFDLSANTGALALEDKERDCCRHKSTGPTGSAQTA